MALKSPTLFTQKWFFGEELVILIPIGVEGQLDILMKTILMKTISTELQGNFLEFMGKAHLLGQ